jgi:FkbH-like protein
MKHQPGSIKCVVWDLDNTLWNGTLLEGDITLRESARMAVEALDSRGILNSIASKNNHADAVMKLQELSLADFFLYPQISWAAKSHSVGQIARDLNIATDSIAFIDDEPYEREEVASSLPDVLCLAADELPTMLERSEFTPRFLTSESKLRRSMYVADMARRDAAERFAGPREQFLSSLGMRVEILEAAESDLQRAEELTVRTHQLNSTGRIYSYDELNLLRESGQHILLIARLTDKFGSYGTVGLALVEKDGLLWTMRLLLLSCRVMGRGIATVLIGHIKRLARDAGARLLAEMVLNERNRVMHVSFVINKFRPVSRAGNSIRFETDLSNIPADPGYLEVVTPHR